MKGNALQSDLLTNIAKETLQFDTIYYCIVKKQSESGLAFNTRTLFIQQSDYTLYYSKQLPQTTFYKSQIIPSGKHKIRLSEATLKRDNKALMVYIKVNRMNLCWKFKFHDQNILDKWVCLFEVMREKVQSVYMYRKSLKNSYSTASISCEQSTTARKTLGKTFSALNFMMPIDEAEKEKKKQIQLGLTITKSFKKLQPSKEILNDF